VPDPGKMPASGFEFWLSEIPAGLRIVVSESSE
jgi:hypothetical protein